MRKLGAYLVEHEGIRARASLTPTRMLIVRDLGVLHHKPIVLQIPGSGNSEKYACITLQDDGAHRIPRYHTIDMNQTGYKSRSGVVSGKNQEIMAANSKHRNYTYGYHYAAIEDDFNSSNRLYATRYSSVPGGSQGLCIGQVELVVFEFKNGMQSEPVVLATLPSKDEFGEGEIQLSTDGTKLIYYNKYLQLGGFQHKNYELFVFTLAKGGLKVDNSQNTTIPGTAGGHWGKAGVDFTAINGQTVFAQRGILDINNGSTTTSRLMRGFDVNLQTSSLFSTTAFGTPRRGYDQFTHVSSLGNNSQLNYFNGSATAGNLLVSPLANRQLTGNLPSQTLRLLKPEEAPFFSREVGNKLFELTDHLGNVRAVVNDIKEPTTYTIGNTSFMANVVSAMDYYAFGMHMPGRTFSSPDYRYGFNGKEKDDEWAGSGNSYDFGDRSYDPRIARFRSIDPMAGNFAANSPYAYAFNNPIFLIDQNGDWGKKPSELAAEWGFEMPPFAAGMLDGAIDAMTGIQTLGMIKDLYDSPQMRADMMNALVAIANDPIGALGEMLTEYADIIDRVISGNATPEDEYKMGEIIGEQLVGMAMGGSNLLTFAKKLLKKPKGKLALKALKNADIKEGVYEITFADDSKYIGQSNNIDRRLKEHVKSGKITEAEALKAKRTEIKGKPGDTEEMEKLAREVEETKQIDKFTEHGKSVKDSKTLTNKVRPISAKRENKLISEGKIEKISQTP